MPYIHKDYCVPRLYKRNQPSNTTLLKVIEYKFLDSQMVINKVSYWIPKSTINQVLSVSLLDIGLKVEKG